MIRIADPDHPWLAEAIAEDAGVAPGVDHGASDPELLQDLDATVH